MLVQKSVMWASNWLAQVAHLTREVQPAALPGGRAPDGRRLLWCRPKTATLTGPVYTRSGCLVLHLCVSICCMYVCGCMRNGLLAQAIGQKVKVCKKCKKYMNCKVTIIKQCQNVNQIITTASQNEFKLTLKCCYQKICPVKTPIYPHLIF